MSDNTFDVIIIGSGPAGWTAAIYASRAALKVIVLEGEQPGGQLTITTDVENYPGFPEGIMGPEMMVRFGDQAKRFGTAVKQETVTKVDFTGSPHKITTSKAVYEARATIIASGARASLLGLESESRLMGYGVSACATCDGFFFGGKKIAVVGGGDSAVEEATFLTKFADKVTMVHRRDKLRASKIMQQRAFDNPKVDFLWNSVVTDVLGDPKSGVTGLLVKSTIDDTETELPMEGLFLAIGHKPNTEFLQGTLEMDKTGYLITHDGTKTSVEGVFAAGDVQDHIYRQAITAAGTGCMAALDAERWLEETKPK